MVPCKQLNPLISLAPGLPRDLTNLCKSKFRFKRVRIPKMVSLAKISLGLMREGG